MKLLRNLETALAGELGQMPLVNDYQTFQSRVFISDSDIQGMVTYIPVGGGAGEMAVGGKLKCGWSRGSWVVQRIKHSMQKKNIIKNTTVSK